MTGAVREMLDLIATLRTAADQCAENESIAEWAERTGGLTLTPMQKGILGIAPFSVAVPEANEDLLYHGTRYMAAILAADCIRLPTVGHQHVSLTSDKDIAIQFALLGRPDDEGEGHVIAFRRADLIAVGHDLQDFDDGFIDPDDFEHEVMTVKPISNLRSLMAWSKRALEDGWGLVGESAQAEAEDRDDMEWEANNG